MRIANKWIDFEVIDAGQGVKIERYNDTILKRPEPTATGALALKSYNADATFDTKWRFKKQLPESIELTYQDMKMLIRPTGFKHTGIFPEQAVNWDWARSVIKEANQPLRILNLFGYTGGATVACAMEDNVVEVVHIDALKSLNAWTQENVKLNNLEHKTVRTITEDVLKFLDREIKRGRTYHGIIMDPPSYGKGPKGEVWRIEEKLPLLLDKAIALLDQDAQFMILNTYTTNLGVNKVKHIFDSHLKRNGVRGYTHSDQIGLPISYKDEKLACGITTRWSKNENSL